MRAGELRHLIDVQKATWTNSTLTGEPVHSWATISSNVWASVEEAEGEEIFSKGFPQDRSRVLLEIHTRYSSVIDRSMRVVWESESYLIKSVDNVDDRDRELIIFAEVVS